MAKKPAILLIGPTPPPYHGVSVAMQAILSSPMVKTFNLIHLDITDRRGISHVNQPDLYDVFLFIKQFFRNVMLLLKEKPAILYLPISQTRIGFIRDSLFIIPALMMRCAVVVHLHGANFERLSIEAGPFWNAYMGSILRRVDHFIVLGEMLRPIFKNWTKPERISVVPNGVSLNSKSDEALPTPSSIKKGPFRVIFLSTLCRQKGLFVFLHAIPLILREEKEVEFVIAGPWRNTQDRQEAETWLANSGFKESIRFVGEMTGSEKRLFFKSGNLFVFPGIQQEGQPLVVLEAMGTGLPVIATDRGCLRETVIDGITGFIIPPNVPEAIAEKVVQLVRSPNLQRSMGEASRKRFELHYTLDQFADRLERIFIKTLNSVDGSEKIDPEWRQNNAS